MCSHTDRIALIPAYQPDEKLPALAREAESKGFSVIVVDDGSGPAYTELFEETQLYATVLTHPFNQGKRGALKTGYLYLIFTGFCLLFGIITLTIGSLVRGILDIYGTSKGYAVPDRRDCVSGSWYRKLYPAGTGLIPVEDKADMSLFPFICIYVSPFSLHLDSDTEWPPQSAACQ